MREGRSSEAVLSVLEEEGFCALLLLCAFCVVLRKGSACLGGVRRKISYSASSILSYYMWVL